MFRSSNALHNITIFAASPRTFSSPLALTLYVSRIDRQFQKASRCAQRRARCGRSLCPSPGYPRVASNCCVGRHRRSSVATWRAGAGHASCAQSSRRSLPALYSLRRSGGVARICAFTRAPFALTRSVLLVVVLRRRVAVGAVVEKAVSAKDCAATQGRNGGPGVRRGSGAGRGPPLHVPHRVQGSCGTRCRAPRASVGGSCHAVG